MSKVSERLKEFMETHGVRQQDIIDKTGISSSCISAYVNGIREPKADKIGLIAQAFNVDAAWLMGFDSKSGIDNVREGMHDADLLVKYHKLNEKYQKAIDTQIDLFLEMQEQP